MLWIIGQIISILMMISASIYFFDNNDKRKRFGSYLFAFCSSLISYYLQLEWVKL